MVARGGEGVGEFAEDIFAVMMNLAGFAVEQFGGANDFAAERRADSLVAETNAEDRKFSSEAANQINADAGILWSARPGRNHDAFRLAARDFLNRNFVIAMYFDVAAQLAKVLRQVIGERIVVIEQQNHIAGSSGWRGAQIPMRSAARATC